MTPELISILKKLDKHIVSYELKHGTSAGRNTSSAKVYANAVAVGQPVLLIVLKQDSVTTLQDTTRGQDIGRQTPNDSRNN